MSLGGRGGRRGLLLALLLALLAGCAAGTGTSGPDPGPPVLPGAAAPPAPPPSTPPPPSPSRARAAVDAADAAGVEPSGAALGVAVLDRATGQVETNEAGTRGLRAASIAKLITTADVLQRRGAGQGTVDPATQDDRIRRALGPSDDEAMNALWSTEGGGEGVGRVAAALGLTATAPPADASQWGETTTSARDVAVVLAALAARPPADRDLVIGALATAPPVAADGFDQAFGLLEPAARGPAAAKQGWLCCLGGTVDLHSAGFPDPAGRYVVALLSNQPDGYAAGRALLDDATGAARAALAAM